MAWWWLLVAWPLVGLLAAAVFHVVVTHVPPDRCHELTPLQRAHLPGGHRLGLRRRPASRPPAGRPGGASLLRQRPTTATGAPMPLGLTRGPVHRLALQAQLVPGRRRRASHRTPRPQEPGAVAQAGCRPRRTAGHGPLAAAARGAVTVFVSVPPHQPPRSIPLAGVAPGGPTGRLRPAWTRGRTARPGPRGRGPQRLLALTALSAIALAPVLARSGSTLGFDDPLEAELAANPDQYSATWDALNRGAAVSGLATPISTRNWRLPPAATASDESGDRSPSRATDPGPGTSTTDSRRTSSAPATSTDDAPSESPTMPPVVVPGDRPPASDDPTGGVTRTTAPTPTDPADPTTPRPTPTPSPTDPTPTPTPEPTPTPTPEPTPTPTPTPTPEPTPTPSPTDPEPTPSPTPVPEPTPTDPAEPTEPDEPDDASATADDVASPGMPAAPPATPVEP